MLFASHAVAPALVFFLLFAGHEQRVEGLGHAEDGSYAKSDETSGSKAGSVQLKANTTATLVPSGLKALSLLLMAFSESSVGKFVHLAPSGRSPLMRKPSSARPVAGRPNSVRPPRQRVQMASDGITGREKDMMGFLGQFRDQQPPTKRKGKDFTDYQEEPGRFHRFISQDDPTFEEYAHNDIVGYICKTPDKFQGLRRDGVLKGTRRVQFTLPGRDDEPKTLELMYSRSKDNPSFGAVRVKLPLNVQVSSEKQRVMVTRVNPGSAADNARIQQGDIIRAISVPESTVEGSGTVSWWDKMMSSPMPKNRGGHGHSQ